MNSFAIIGNRLDMFAQNNIIFYDPCNNLDDSNQGICTIPSGNEITWIGDSYSVGAEAIIREYFPGVDYGSGIDSDTSYIQSCKFVNTDTDCNANPTNPSGINVLQKIISENKLRDYLVFALGTNGEWNSEGVEILMNMVGQKTQVILVNSWTKDNKYNDSNELLRKVSEEYNNVTVADWASVANDRYFEQDAVHPTSNNGYRIWVDTIKNALPKTCSAGLLPGDTNEEMIWNYFVQANIPNVSNDPVVIAAIIGNFKLESDLDPFSGALDATYHGLWQEMSEDFTSRIVNQPDFINYWGNGGAAPRDIINKAIKMELDWLIANNVRFNGTGWASDWGFLKSLNKVTNKTPEAYSDLFVVTVEGAIEVEGIPGDLILDDGVAKIARERFNSERYQGAQKRRELSRDFYDRLSEIASVPSGSASKFADLATMSSNGNFKYDLSDKELEELVKFAVWKDIDNYGTVLSEIADDFENHVDVKNITNPGYSLVEYVKSDKNFIYRIDYDNNYNGDVEINSEQLESASKILKDGLRLTTNNSKSIVGSTSQQSVAGCPSSASSIGGSNRIAQLAALMSWPVQSGQIESPDYDNSRVGKCNEYNGDWVNFAFDATCMTTPRVMYKNEWDKLHAEYGWFDEYMDCGFFVASVLQYAGVVNQEVANQPYFNTAIMNQKGWIEVGHVKSEDDLLPGDVLWSSQHIILFVGQYGGEYGNVAHASRDTRVGQIGHAYDISNWNVYRYVGGN